MVLVGEEEEEEEEEQAQAQAQEQEQGQGQGQGQEQEQEETHGLVARGQAEAGRCGQSGLGNWEGPGLRFMSKMESSFPNSFGYHVWSKRPAMLFLPKSTSPTPMACVPGTPMCTIAETLAWASRSEMSSGTAVVSSTSTWPFAAARTLAMRVCCAGDMVRFSASWPSAAVVRSARESGALQNI